MKSKLVITLTEKTTTNYLREASRQMTAEVAECVVPSGAVLTIEINPPFDDCAYLDGVELGEVTVKLIQTD